LVKKGETMKVFIVVGMPASGKNIARTYAEEQVIPYFASGDIVRGEVKKRGLTPDARNMAAVSTELRGADGLGVTRCVLAAAQESNAQTVFLEGMRSWPEIELIRKEMDCTVIAFLAPRRLRLERIISRGRSDDSPDVFEDRDLREIEYGTAIPIALADEYLVNTATMEDALAALDTIVQREPRIKP
jgi:dephospho-CoA kinase